MTQGDRSMGTERTLLDALADLRAAVSPESWARVQTIVSLVERDQDAEIARLRAENERLVRKADNSHALVVYICDRAGEITGVELDAPSDVVDAIRNLYAMAEEGKQWQARAEAAEAALRDARDTMRSVEKEPGAAGRVCYHLREAFAAVLKETP